MTVTERGSFRRCQRMWHYTSKNGDHLTPIVVSPALNIGTLIHQAGEQWLLDPAGSYADYVVAASADMEETVKKRYRAQVGANISEAEMAPFYDSVMMARQMAENYQARWGTPLPDGFECIQPEQKIQIPIPGTDHACETCSGNGYLGENTKEYGKRCEDCTGDGVALHFLEGRLDALLRGTKDGSIWVLERKTYGQRPKMDTLQYSDQFLAYHWMLTQLKAAKVGGVAYDGLWKRDRVPRGRTFEDLFLRVTITRNAAEIAEFERLLRYEVMEMAAVQERGEFTINRVWQGCWDCGMTKLCYATSRGEDLTAVRRQHYTERTDDLEEVVEEVE